MANKRLLNIVGEDSTSLHPIPLLIYLIILIKKTKLLANTIKKQHTHFNFQICCTYLVQYV